MKEILKGHIIHAPALGELNIMENGYMVLCDGIIEGIYDQLPAAHRDGVLHDYGDKLIMQSFADNSSQRECAFLSVSLFIFVRKVGYCLML